MSLVTKGKSILGDLPFVCNPAERTVRNLDSIEPPQDEIYIPAIFVNLEKMQYLRDFSNLLHDKTRRETKWYNINIRYIIFKGGR